MRGKEKKNFFKSENVQMFVECRLKFVIKFAARLTRTDRDQV